MSSLRTLCDILHSEHHAAAAAVIPTPNAHLTPCVCLHANEGVHQFHELPILQTHPSLEQRAVLDLHRVKKGVGCLITEIAGNGTPRPQAD